MNPAITLEGVSKSYRIHRRARGGRAWWQALSGGEKVRRRTVLQDIRLSIAHGESVAILGRNGAGKSSLLKLVAGVARPDRGSVSVDGRVGPLIELGAGFHPEETAVPNVRAAATLMGADPARLKSLVDEVVAFSGLEQHLGKPLKHFSSGMVVRLGFAVIAAVRPPILLSDEVLAVGDESFQKRCIAWLESYLGAGNTLVLVSHNLYHVQKICRRAVWLEEGRIREDGDVFSVSQSYLSFHEALARGAEDRGENPREEVVSELSLETIDAAASRSVAGRTSATVTGRLRAPRAVLRVLRLDGTVLTRVEVPRPGPFAVEVGTERLLPGRYALEVADPERAFRTRRMLLDVEGASREFGSCRLACAWN